MVLNERQYRITRAQLSRLRAALRRARRGALHPHLFRAHQEGIRSQIRDLKRELTHYEQLKARGDKRLRLARLDGLPAALVQARILRGWTQADLARRLHVPPQQVQRYEATMYRSASLERILTISNVLGIDLARQADLQVG